MSAENKSAKRRPLQLELLEAREVPSAVPTYQLDARDFAWINEQISILPESGDLFADAWIVSVAENVNPQNLTQKLTVTSTTPQPLIQDTYRWDFATGTDRMATLNQLSTAQAQGEINFFYPLIRQVAETRFIPNDPLFDGQWHLQNTGQTGGTVGADANWVPAWDIATGKGVIVSIVDGGVELTHPDLAPNLVSNPGETPDGTDSDGNGLIDDINGWNFLDGNNNPNPVGANDNHGTAVAGVAVAAGNNGVGVTGAAFDAGLVALRLVGPPGATDDQNAAAINYLNQFVHVSNNSWGPPDSGTLLGAPGPLARAALQDAATNGRDGKGVVIVWAGGNGRPADHVNADGYANSRFTLAIGAVGHDGVVAPYSEAGAPLIVVAPSGPAGAEGITTTDRTGAAGYNDGSAGDPLPGEPDYTNDFSGTSSATPLVSGVIALMLEVRPDLGYRDVRAILMESATKNDPTNAGWQVNGAGHDFHADYGFGMVNAFEAVTLSQTWDLVGPEIKVASPIVQVNQPIPDNLPTGVTATVDIIQNIDIEYVEVLFNATHTYRGDLRVMLTSPSGTTVELASPRPFDSDEDFDNWIFGAATFYQESSAGTWTIQVIDTFDEDVGTFDFFQITVYGTDGTPPLPPVPPGVFTPGDTGMLAPDDNRVGGRPVAVSQGGGGIGRVMALNAPAGLTRFAAFPFGENFPFAIRATMADVNGDGVADLIAGVGPGGGPVVRVIDGFTGEEIGSFFAYDPNFRGGIFVAAGDVTGNGIAEIIVSADAGGGPHLRIFDGRSFQEIVGWMAYDPSFRGGLNVAVGDVNGDGFADIITGAGFGGGPHVQIFDGQTGAIISSFFAYDAGFRGGVFVSAGDINGNGLAEVVTGPGLGGRAHIRAFSTTTGEIVTNFLAYPEFEDHIYGGRVSVHDTDLDGQVEIVVAPGPGIHGRVRVFDPAGNLLNQEFPFGVAYFDGIFVG